MLSNKKIYEIEKNMLRLFGHVERMNDTKLGKDIYGVDDNAVTGRPRRTFLDKIDLALEKRYVKRPETSEHLKGI
jgi:hypothetical protein